MPLVTCPSCATRQPAGSVCLARRCGARFPLSAGRATERRVLRVALLAATLEDGDRLPVLPGESLAGVNADARALRIRQQTEMAPPATAARQMRCRAEPRVKMHPRPDGRGFGPRTPR